jgi:hypothetical protein
MATNSFFRSPKSSLIRFPAWDCAAESPSRKARPITAQRVIPLPISAAMARALNPFARSSRNIASRSGVHVEKLTRGGRPIRRRQRSTALGQQPKLRPMSVRVVPASQATTTWLSHSGCQSVPMRRFGSDMISPFRRRREPRPRLYWATTGARRHRFEGGSLSQCPQYNRRCAPARFRQPAKLNQSFGCGIPAPNRRQKGEGVTNDPVRVTPSVPSKTMAVLNI